MFFSIKNDNFGDKMLKIKKMKTKIEKLALYNGTTLCC